MTTPWLYRKVRGLTRRILIACGVDFYHDSDDRRALETVIMPYLAGREDVRNILFVGCAWYTRGYRKIFRGKRYSTLEIDPRAAKYGAAHHIIDSLENIGRHFEANTLDAIICNGVFGWGLDEPAAIDRAFDGCFASLREGGIFVLGWNDVPDHTPVALEQLRSLPRFTPWAFPPLGVCRHRTDTYNRHTFDFYVKPGPNLPRQRG